MHQDQADAPGGEQGLQRPAVEETDDAALQRHADQGRSEERRGHGRGEVPVEQARQARAEQVLHDVGAVGADHDQFAVRHVDHPHQAVGDGEAECGKHQDGTETDAGEHLADALTDGQPGLDRLERILRFGANACIGLDKIVALLFQQPEQQRLGAGAVAPRERLDRRHAHAGVRALQLHAGLNQTQQFLDLRVGLGGKRLADQRQHFLAGAVFQRLDRGEPHGPVGRSQLQRAHRRLERAAQAVVDHRVLQSIGQRRHLFVGGGIDALFVLDDQYALAARYLHVPVQQRLEKGFDPGIAGSHQLAHRRYLLVALACRDRPHQFGGQGAGEARPEKKR